MQKTPSARSVVLTVATAIAVLAASAAAVSGEAPKSQAQRTIEYRQSVMRLLGWNIGPIAAMVKGEAAYDETAIKLRAMRLAQLAPMIVEGFPPGSQEGAPTKAKPEIWEDMDDFRAKAESLERATTAFATTAADGDKALVTKGLGEVGNACKACHDKYHAK